MLFRSGPKMIIAYDQTFFYMGMEQGSRSYDWISMLGTPSEAKGYDYQLTLRGPNGDKRSYTGQVHSLEENWKTIVKDADCFIYGAAIVKSFKNEAENHKMEVKIRRSRRQAATSSAIAI